MSSEVPESAPAQKITKQSNDPLELVNSMFGYSIDKEEVTSKTEETMAKMKWVVAAMLEQQVPRLGLLLNYLKKSEGLVFDEERLRQQDISIEQVMEERMMAEKSLFQLLEFIKDFSKSGNPQTSIMIQQNIKNEHNPLESMTVEELHRAMGKLDEIEALDITEVENDRGRQEGESPFKGTDKG